MNTNTQLHFKKSLLLPSDQGTHTGKMYGRPGDKGTMPVGRKRYFRLTQWENRPNGFSRLYFLGCGSMKDQQQKQMDADYQQHSWLIVLYSKSVAKYLLLCAKWGSIGLRADLAEL